MILFRATIYGAPGEVRTRDPSIIVPTAGVEPTSLINFN